MGDAHKYGKLYWGIEVDARRTVMVHADRARTEAGALILESESKDSPGTFEIRIAFAAGMWRQIWAASVLDGHPVAVVSDE